MSLSEMSLMKRLFSGVAVAALAVTLAACSDEKKETAKAPETSQTTTESASSTPATSTATTTETATTPTTTTTTTTTETAQTSAAETKSVELPTSEGDVDMAEVLKPGALPDMALGEANAPVTIVEYMSTTCPHCAAFHNNTFDAIKEKYVDSGKVRFIMREFPFDPRASGAFMLARCSGDDKWYATIDLLYRAQETWARGKDAAGAFKSIMGMTGMDGAKVEACLSDQTLLEKVSAVAEKGRSFGVEATPTFFVNGELYKDAYSAEAFSSKIDSLLTANK